ncbi:MAG: hypothetical protein NDJ90_06735 [Oligoflexia bacterium]|nr:hypothetical protein [Oligoflexia bacterium]
MERLRHRLDPIFLVALLGVSVRTWAALGPEQAEPAGSGLLYVGAVLALTAVAFACSLRLLRRK